MLPCGCRSEGLKIITQGFDDTADDEDDNGVDNNDLKGGHPRVIFCIKQGGQSVPHWEYGEDAPEEGHDQDDEDVQDDDLDNDDPLTSERRALEASDMM